LNSCRHATLHVSANHVGQFAEYVAHVIVHNAGWVHGENSASELAGLLWIAIEQHCAVPIASQMNE
jgi:hypothetical protein